MGAATTVKITAKTVKITAKMAKVPLMPDDTISNICLAKPSETVDKVDKVEKRECEYLAKAYRQNGYANTERHGQNDSTARQFIAISAG